MHPGGARSPTRTGVVGQQVQQVLIRLAIHSQVHGGCIHTKQRRGPPHEQRRGPPHEQRREPTHEQRREPTHDHGAKGQGTTRAVPPQRSLLSRQAATEGPRSRDCNGRGSCRPWRSSLRRAQFDPPKQLSMQRLHPPEKPRSREGTGRASTFSNTNSCSRSVRRSTVSLPSSGPLQ